MNDVPPPQPQPQSPPQIAPEMAPKDTPEPKAEPPQSHGQVTCDDSTFNTSVRDAYALLDFSTRRGMTIPSHITTTIVQAYDKVSEQKPMAINEQTAFWDAFREIIDQVKPVTVESILFSAPKTDATPPTSWWTALFSSASPADGVLKRYLLFSMISLLLLLALQMEWAIGTSTYNDAYKVHGYLLNTQELLEDAELKADPSTTTTNDGASTTNLTLQGQDDITITKLKRQLQQDQSWDDVSYVRLWWWNRQNAKLFPPYDLSLSDDDEDDGPKFHAGDLTLGQEGKRRVEFTRAELTLEIISNYVLVTLFALLGAMTQALRTLAEQIRTVSLTQTKLYSIRTRIILGVISGVCMAWLLINSDPSSGDVSSLDTTPLNAISFLGSFTPWAVAFISGYSVEIFFTALERAIAIITKYLENVANGVAPGSAAAQPAQTGGQSVIQQGPEKGEPEKKAS